MKYYVYTHSLDGQVFYVGKGCRNRAQLFKRRSKLWHDIVGDRQAEIEIEIVKYFDDEMKAFDFEGELTAYFKNIGQAQANKIIGTKPTDETKRLLSETKKGDRNGMYGKRGAKSHFAKPIVAIFPDGRQIKTGSQKDMTAILSREYNMTEKMVKHLAETGRPYNPRFKQHKALKGLILKYSG